MSFKQREICLKLKIDMDIKSFNIKHNVLNKETKTTDNDPDNMSMLRFYSRLNAIFIPNSSLIEYFDREIFEKNGYFAKLEVQRIMINKGLLKVNKVLNEVSLIVFYLLHEEGHYIHFNNDFLLRRLNYRNFSEQYIIHKEQCEKTFCDRYGSKKDEEAYKGFAKLYREHPFEKIADNYALEQILRRKHFLGLF